MRRTCWLVCLAGLVVSVEGCGWERQELLEERERVEARRAALRTHVDKNAPVGSRWVTHPDTQRALGEIRDHDAKIREIDRQLESR
jgi:hypothetical protein